MPSWALLTQLIFLLSDSKVSIDLKPTFTKSEYKTASDTRNSVITGRTIQVSSSLGKRASFLCSNYAVCDDTPGAHSLGPHFFLLLMSLPTSKSSRESSSQAPDSGPITATGFVSLSSLDVEFKQSEP